MNFRKSDLRKKHVGNLMDRKNRAGYLFIAPFLFGMLFIFLPALAESFKYSLEFAAIKFNYVEQEYIGFENYVEAVTNDTDFLPMLYSAIRGTLVDLVVILFFSFFIAVMFGLVFPFSQRLIVPTDTASALANSSCDSSAFLRIVFSRILNGIRQHSPSR